MCMYVCVCCVVLRVQLAEIMSPGLPQLFVVEIDARGHLHVTCTTLSLPVVVRCRPLSSAVSCCHPVGLVG